MERSGALWRAASGLGSGLLFAAAQPGFGLWPLAFVCLVPLLVAWRGSSTRTRIVLAWWAGTVGTTVATLGAGVTGASSYFGLPGVAAVAVSIAVGQVFGAFSFAGLAVVGGDPLGGSGRLRGLRFAGALAGVELLRGAVFTGFPWLLLAYSLLPAPEWAAAAAFVGATGVSLLLAWANVAIAALLFSPGERIRSASRLALVCVLLVAPGFVNRQAPAGSVRVATGPAPPEGSKRVLLVQPGAVPSGDARGPVAVADALVQRTLDGEPFDVAVWPENAVAALLPSNLHLLRSAVQRGIGAPLILGAPRTDPKDGRFRTSALLVGVGGEILAHHDKRHLLPFAEYAPGPLPMEWFGPIEILPGVAPGVLPVRGASFGPLICYEVLFSGLARDQVRAGATVLLNLSNDAWFGDTGAVEQHLAAAMLR
ncbi:MAG: apolipoprotein N-acyltransferase, partial [Myxococcales bacterium]|nr:apolipoprotein N-acyltransferase [Myxococcales bacterium]